MRVWPSVLAWTLTASLVCALLMRYTLRRAVEAVALSDAAGQAIALLHGLATPKLHGDLARGDEPALLSSLLRARDAGASSAFVCDADGRVAAHTDVARVGSLCASEPAREALASARLSWEAVSGERLEAALPVRPAPDVEALLLGDEGRPAGAVVVDIPVADALGQARRISDRASLAFAAFAALLLGAGLWVLRRVVHAFDGALDTMLDGVLIVDAEGRVEFMNAAAAALLGGPPRDWKGRPLADALDGARDLLKVLRRGLSVRDREVSVRGKDGAVDALCAAGPLDRGPTRRFVVTLKDITVRKRLERLEADRTRDDMQRQFVANVSHEFRTPLAAIRGFADTLLSGGLEDAKNRREFVAIIGRHATRLSRLVEDLLQLSVLESGKNDEPIEAIEIAPFCETVARGLAPVAAKAGVSFELEIEADLVALAAPDRLEQVLVNLVKNAIEYNRRGGRVFVSGGLRGRFVELAISDTGVGLEADELAGLFRRFHRGARAKKLKPEGTGLGLLIVKRIIESLGGAVWAESTVGRGSTFFFTLPARVDAPREKAAERSLVRIV